MMIILYIFLGIVALFILLQYSIVFSAKRTQGTKISGLPAKLKSLEKNGSKGIVYFFSPSCRACKAQTPIIKSLQKGYRNVFDVDISSDMETARIFGIKATPATVGVKNGVIDKVYVGVKQKDIFEQYLKR
jgi:thioredoxin 1